MSRNPFPAGTRLVMAHPDDEALWATSVLSSVDRIVLCFGDVASQPGWSEGRRRSAEAYPLPNVTHLGIPESEVFNSAGWPEPLEIDTGLAVKKTPSSLRGFSASRYLENSDRLVNALRPLLAGSQCVITHSPWGEYGHEEHVQVFRAVAEVKVEMGFELWVPGYVSNKSFSLMTRHMSSLDSVSEPLATDSELGARLQSLYAENGCWTWFDDYTWPTHEYFYRWAGSGGRTESTSANRLVAMNVLWLDPQKPRRGSRPLIPRIVRRVRRLVS